MVRSFSPSSTLSRSESFVTSTAWGVDIHAVDMVQQDALALGGGQFPLPPLHLDRAPVLRLLPISPDPGI